MILILLLFVPTTLANCDDEDTCFCTDIRPFYTNFWSLPDESLFYSDGLACAHNLTCRLAKNTYFYSAWEDTTIPKPNVEQSISDIHFPAMDDANLHRVGEFANLHELFGVVCEDFKWYITKYPFGFSYLKYADNTDEEENEWVHVDASEIAGESHKTVLRFFSCSDEDCQKKEMDMCNYD